MQIMHNDQFVASVQGESFQEIRLCLIGLWRENKEWLFSGVAVAVPLAIIGRLYKKRNKGESNNGSGNRAGRDQTITNDNSMH